MRDHEREQASPAAHAPRPERPVHRSDEDAGPAPAAGPARDTAGVLHLQRTAGNQATVQLLAGEEERSPVHDVVGGGGRPLDEGTRAPMEAAFGTSFEDVRVHTDDAASKSAESVGASAYTVGSDMVFRSGEFDPGTRTGQRTIAHELAHVVQQSEGPVEGTEAPGGIRISDPGDRHEQAADDQADRVMAAAGAAAGPVAATSSDAASVQREEDETLRVQRVPAAGEDEEQEEEA